jgi:hypothetical protein
LLASTGKTFPDFILNDKLLLMVCEIAELATKPLHNNNNVLIFLSLLFIIECFSMF